MKYFPNKYRGVCRRCGGKIAPMDGICERSPDNGSWLIGCRGCFPAEYAAVNADRIAANKAEQDRLEALEQARLAAVAKRNALIEKLGLKMDQGYDCKTQQFSWHDQSTWKVPFTGDGTDAEFAEAISRPAQSSYGRLRWSDGISLVEVNRQERYVVLSESVSLCD